MPDNDVKNVGPPPEIYAIREWITAAFVELDDEGREVGDANFGVYAFFDYDGEPIYVGQTRESLRTRIRRHLTNQRTDAVAMSVLDPFEVLEVVMWPLWELEDEAVPQSERTKRLNDAEFTVFQMVLTESSFSAVLNEKDPPTGDSISLPEPVRVRIVPDDVYELRKHPDTRIARRAMTIAALAKVISERSVSKGLRRTLLTQARRLEALARGRYDEVAGEPPVEESGEETGEEAAPGAED